MGAEPIPDAVRRVVLVGFMAAGKTAVGRILARRLGWEFVDLDDWIARETGSSPGALIRERGEAAFREAESRATTRLATRTAAVIAPGGGWITVPGRVEALGPGTVTVWLRVGAEEAVRRAEAEASSSGVDRPLLGAGPGRVERARRLLAEREASYARADLEVDAEAGDPERIAEEIYRRLRSWTAVGGAADAGGE